jgi:hypothetical protein
LIWPPDLSGHGSHWIGADPGNFEAATPRLRVVQVCWTDPDAALMQRARQAGSALVAWQVGSLDGALTAADAGCELLASVPAPTSIPVVAAGGGNHQAFSA